MGRACSTYGGGEVHTKFCWGNGKRPLGKPGVDGNVILK